MKVTQVRVEAHPLTLTRPIGDANDPVGQWHQRQLVIALDTDEGLVGYAVAVPGCLGVLPVFADVVIGKDPAGVRGLWEAMVGRAFKAGVNGMTRVAIAALDVALWDLKAQANSEPLWRTLGATASSVPVYASGIEMPLGDAELVEYYRRQSTHGISFGKIKVGRDREDDLRRLRLAAQALAESGKPVRLAVDANEYWSAKTAIPWVRALEQEHPLVWVEEPCPRRDVRALARVSAGVDAAVATGENLNLVDEFLPLLLGGAVDVVQVGIQTTGISGALRVAETAAGFGLPVATVNCPGHVIAHLAAVLPNHLALEVLDAGEDALLEVDHTLGDGHLKLGSRPGHGVRPRAGLPVTDVLPRTGAAVLPGRGPGAGLLPPGFTPRSRTTGRITDHTTGCITDHTRD
ncbi:mandelate racemase/muconate lactonizing enzyme family protein [Streptomyces sp. NPDC059720]|uniref:mandelate racemase/muconate lactonizing enzyme family protein n=1 Tax=Streptomyces sp. NPDC059720 TaxID=3346924 RepID=UPI0036B964D1